MSVMGYIEGRSAGFLCAVLRVCQAVGIHDARYLLAIMQFESGMDPQCVNHESGATGLIQFLRSTARDLGITIDALLLMSDLEQLVYVQKYLEWWKDLYQQSPEDLPSTYMMVLMPAAIKGPDKETLWTRGSLAYAQNAGLDLNRDGVITKEEAAYRVLKIYDDMCAAERGCDVADLVE
jgi:hypothetical protein